MGNYKIIGVLGEGGNSVAYQGIDKATGYRVTVKCAKENALKNLENEARILQKLDHHSIPKLIEKHEDTIVLEHIQGMSLEKVMSSEGRFDEKRVRKIAIELSEILRYLHGRREPVIYRDLKPANVVMRPDGEIALIDFGAARYYSLGEKSDTQNIGTRGFAAPEQFGNLGQTDPRTDIYCLGMTVLQLLTSVDPGDSETIERFKKNGVKGVSKELMQIIDKCIRPDRDDRFRSVIELSESLKKYPGIRVRRLIGTAVKRTMIAAVAAVILTLGVLNMGTVKSYAEDDLEKRMPYVRQRLYYAHERIEEFLENNLGVVLK